MVGGGGMKRHELVHIWPEAGALNRELESFYGGIIALLPQLIKLKVSFLKDRY